MDKLFLVFFTCSCFTAFGQDALHSSMLTLGVGGMPYSDNPYYPDLQKGGPAFTGDYEYRLSKYLAIEGGTDVLLPSGKQFGVIASIPAGENLVYFCCTAVLAPISERSRVTLLTYGVKGLLPLAHDRLELFAGLGGAYAWNSELSGQLNSAFAQASVGARLAVDRGHRFWLGTTLRGFATFGPGRQDWVPLTFDFGIRFAH